MRCHICDRLLTEPTFNRDHEDWEPCDECDQVIQDTLAGYYDRPAVDEDELGVEIIVEFPLQYQQDVDFT